ncbi:uncharacterized protein UV8b_06949 [Ustilaginoidea virens]|uniref:RWD domain-containing protein n=1 Tax=Ustilaginoidea virens TaxID=1159556 RepID=A0A8E5HW98_USTVR|nr:uncharacterized protein UV8b_06949 [Ustilaginoidea virens]QUC22708.1 hypothetical protein UV8b_06949 [Ustilaginoidea virens]
MSEDLVDEIEAVNSIYGPGSLEPADRDDGSYILRLPGDASSLRLQFPGAYPASPPAVLGTHRSSGGVRGAGARDLRLFEEALGRVFRAGQVCVFDAVEELLAARRGGGPGAAAGDAAGDAAGAEIAADADADEASGPAPEWIVSEAVVEKGSRFVARVARVASVEEARRSVGHLLASDRRVRGATHNVTAWRIKGDAGTRFQDCDDDGEAAAGGRLLHLMQVMGVWGAVVVVTRWYGGVKLGPRRFAVMNAVAREGFVRAGVAGGEG